MNNNKVHIRKEGKFVEYEDVPLENVQIVEGLTVGRLYDEYISLKEQLEVANNKIDKLGKVVIALSNNMNEFTIESRAKIANMQEGE